MTMLLNRSRMALVAGAATMALVALTQVAAAQITAEQQSAIRASCRSDFMSKCSGVTPGGKDALVCLQKNVASLSPACKTAVSATIPAPAQPVQAAPAAAKAAPPAPAPAPPAAAATAPAPPPPPAAASAAPPSAAPARPAPKPTAAAAPPPAKPQAPPKPAAAAPAPQAPPAVAAAPPAAEPQPSTAQRPFPRGSLLVAKACARYLVMHCAGIEPGDGRAIACLMDYRGAGNFVGPRCQAALNIGASVR